MSNYIDSLSDIPKTTRYRNKMYANPHTFNLKSAANEFVRDNQKKNTKAKEKVANFFTVIREFWVKSGKGWTIKYAVYWRAVYLKRPLKKRLNEIRSGKRTVIKWE